MTTTTNYASATESAKILKATLRKAFPATTFSVRLSRGTGYGYCSVGWTDGPTAARVREITCRFEGEGFDGMTDSSYNIDNVLPNGKETGLRGIHTSRDISPKFARRLSAQISAYWGVEMPEIVEYEGWNGRPAWKITSDSRYLGDTGHFPSSLIHQAAQDATKFRREAR